MRWYVLGMTFADEIAQVLQQRQSLWTVQEWRSSKDVVLVCVNGHERSVQMGNARRLKTDYSCSQCTEDEVRRYIQKECAGWTIHAYENSKRFTVVCDAGHEKVMSRYQLMHVEGAGVCLQCDFDARAHAAKALVADKFPDWSVAHYDNNEKMVVACPNGHEKATTTRQLRDASMLRCGGCCEEEAKTLLSNKGPEWTLVNYVRSKEIVVACPDGHQQVFQLGQLRLMKGHVRCWVCCPPG
jgi:hypothetical protein